MIMTLGGEHTDSPLARTVEEIVNAWAIHRGIVYRKAESEPLKHETAQVPQQPPWVEFFLAFDVEYRKRRLHFLIEGQNRLYRLLDEGHFAGLEPTVVDRLKREFYLHLDALQRCEEVGFFSSQVHSLAERLFRNMPSAVELRDPEAYARRFIASNHVDTIDQLIEQWAKKST